VTGPGRALRRALVIHPGALGDVLLALPALAHLRALAGGVERTLAVAPGPAALLDGSGHAERTLDLDRLGLHGLFMTDADPAVVHRLALYDAIVSWLGAGDATYAGHIMRLGRPVVIARATPPPDDRRHASRYLLDTLAPLGPVPAALPPVRLAVADDERAWALGWLAARGLGREDAVVLHPGAGSPAKVWPRHGALARRLADQGRPVVVVTGPADAAAARWVGQAPGRGVHHAPGLPLRRLAGLLAVAGAFIGNDSGPTHLAAGVGCPTLALFGPSDPARWAPIGAHVRVLAGAGPGAADPWAGLDVERVAAALAGVATASPAGAAGGR